MSIYIKVSNLPDAIKNAVKSYIGLNTDIEVKSAAQIEINCDVTFQGNRALHVAIDCATGNKSETMGTWGGSTAFVQSSMERHTVDIPNNTAILSGETGYKTILRLYVNPSLLDSFSLPEAPEMSDELLCMLWNIKVHNTAGRKDCSEEYGLGEYNKHNPHVLALESKGLVKINKAGSISLTTQGKSLAPRNSTLKSKYCR